MRLPLLMAGIFLCACSRKPAASGNSSEKNQQRFERQLLNPAPATITDVRYDEDLFGDPAYFLAFRCSAADADHIITGKNFIKGAPLITSGFRPKWWKLSELGVGPVTYNHETKRSIESLWVNEDKTHCYYVFWGL